MSPEKQQRVSVSMTAEGGKDRWERHHQDGGSSWRNGESGCVHMDLAFRQHSYMPKSADLEMVAGDADKSGR